GGPVLIGIRLVVLLDFRVRRFLDGGYEAHLVFFLQFFDFGGSLGNPALADVFGDHGTADLVQFRGTGGIVGVHTQNQIRAVASENTGVGTRPQPVFFTEEQAVELFHGSQIHPVASGLQAADAALFVLGLVVRVARGDGAERRAS